MARQAGVSRYLAHGLFAENLFAVPVAFAEHEPADACHGPRGVTSAAPASDQWQAIDCECFAVAHGPILIARADGSHHAIAEQGANVLLGRILQGRGADDEEGSGLLRRQIVLDGLQLFPGHALAFRRGGLPFKPAGRFRMLA
jgi:hypothetical protein